MLDKLGFKIRPMEFGDEAGVTRKSRCHGDSVLELIAEFENENDAAINILPYSLGALDIAYRNDAKTVPRFVHALNARVTENGPIALPLLANQPIELAGRCPGVPHLEATILLLGEGQPIVVFGPTTQHSAHAFYSIEWDGGGTIHVRGRHKFIGIDGRRLEPGETLPAEKWFVQICDGQDFNTALDEYLVFLVAEVPYSNSPNPLTDDTFLATWNNHAYWLVDEDTVRSTSEKLQQQFPDTRWLVIDDGYQQTPTKPTMPSSVNGDYSHSFAIEKEWIVQAPGVTFGFSTGDGVDNDAFPNGLSGAAEIIKKNGLRPGIWVGMEAAWSSPAVRENPDWFFKSNFHDDDDPELNRAIPDLSIEEVRNEIEATFRFLFKECGFEALKIDFVTLLTDDPGIRYKNAQKSGAEWRKWLFEMIRQYVPECGFVTLACYIPMGAPFYGSWLDSARHSYDQRDGDWQNILRNIRWSVVPQMGLGRNFPLLDADSLSIFPGVDRTALKLWADYALTAGTLQEFSGSLDRLEAEDVDLLKFYLNNKENGSKVSYGEFSFLESDGLPRVIFRPCPASLMASPPDTTRCFLVCLCNWSDEPEPVDVRNWSPILQECSQLTDLHSGDELTLAALDSMIIPPRSSKLLRTTEAPSTNN